MKKCISLLLVLGISSATPVLAGRMNFETIEQIAAIEMPSSDARFKILATAGIIGVPTAIYALYNLFVCCTGKTNKLNAALKDSEALVRKVEDKRDELGLGIGEDEYADYLQRLKDARDRLQKSMDEAGDTMWFDPDFSAGQKAWSVAGGAVAALALASFLIATVSCQKSSEEDDSNSDSETYTHTETNTEEITEATVVESEAQAVLRALDRLIEKLQLYLYRF